MDIKIAFEKIMQSQNEIALATSINAIPNVRIVNFYYDTIAKKIYFTSFCENDKVKEFSLNPNSAFTTIPHGTTEHVKGKGIVSISNLTIFDIQEKFIDKILDYQETIEFGGKQLILFEIPLLLR